MSCAALRVINSATEKIELKNVVRTVLLRQINTLFPGKLLADGKISITTFWITQSSLSYPYQLSKRLIKITARICCLDLFTTVSYRSNSYTCKPRKWESCQAMSELKSGTGQIFFKSTSRDFELKRGQSESTHERERG